MKIAVFGAGAWGTALAMAAAPRHEVLLWARNAAHVLQMQSTGRNGMYLPEVALPPGLRVTGDFTQAVAHAAGGLHVIATPMAGLREQLRAQLGNRPVLWLCPGL
jgi:glycerol-3-phosphate dehydrogenase (NAD(P)+)